MLPVNSFSILSIISSNRLSGPGAAALQQATLLAETGHNLTFACLPGKNLADRARAAGLQVDTSLSLPRKGELWQLPGDVRQIREMITEKQINLVMVHQTIETATTAVAVGSKVPLIRIFHSGLDKPLGWANRLFFKLFPVVAIATSPAGGRALGRSALTPDGERIILPGAVDSKAFNPEIDGSAMRKELGFKDADPVVGIVSRWKAGRGLGDFLKAFAMAKAKEPRLQALLIGRGEGRQALVEKVASLKLADSVVFCSPEERFREALAVMDMGALMRPGSDGTARAALEMMAIGKPLALMKQGSLADLTGLPDLPATIICNNIEEMADALVSYAGEASLRERYSNNARALIESCHTLAHLSDALGSLCARAIAQKWGIRVR
ncbi:MAG: glycosyltransferase family 4 protein [Planctomycetes bacterium]|nr:glycosyltransferase family 4 protein [Planctomycetota bacterium]